VVTDYCPPSDVPIPSPMPGLSHWGCWRGWTGGRTRQASATRRRHEQGHGGRSSGQDRAGWVSQTSNDSYSRDEISGSPNKATQRVAHVGSGGRAH